MIGLLALAACQHHAVIPDDPKPTLPLVAVAPAALCVTKGALGGAAVTVPTFRAIAAGTTGDAAALAFTFAGDSAKTRALASGQLRRQLGLKLRAANGCNLIYVMWRLDPRPELEVSIKLNPGQRTHKQCGAAGYTRLLAARRGPISDLAPGARHRLHAEISGDVLAAWIDDRLAWVGELPAEARDLVGPAGVRSDNVAFTIEELAAVARVGGGSGRSSGSGRGGDDRCKVSPAEPADPDDDD